MRSVSRGISTVSEVWPGSRARRFDFAGGGDNLHVVLAAGSMLSRSRRLLWRPVGDKCMSDGVNMIAMVKDEDRFVFLYDDESPAEVLRTFGQYAADPELNFSWYDAAVLSQRVREAQDEVNANRDEQDGFGDTYRRAA